MKSTTKMLALLFAASFVLFGAGNVLAGEYDSAKNNPIFLEEGIKHAEEGIAAANGGDAEGAYTHIKAALDTLKEINSEANAPKIQSAGGKLRKASGLARKAKKADGAEATDFLSKSAEAAQKGVDKLKKLNFNH